MHLLHIDQHSDLAHPKKGPDALNVQDINHVAQYVNESLQVGSFIQPALSLGRLADQVQIRSEW